MSDMDDRRENRNIARELRYMVAENVAKDFRDKRSRAAIRAALKWLSLNGVCAWKLGRSSYDVNMAPAKSKLRDLDKTVAIVVDNEAYDKMVALFEKAPAKKRARRK